MARIPAVPEADAGFFGRLGYRYARRRFGAVPEPFTAEEWTDRLAALERHLDGLERTHDLIVEREGVFKEAVLAMRMAKMVARAAAAATMEAVVAPSSAHWLRIRLRAWAIRRWIADVSVGCTGGS